MTSIAFPGHADAIAFPGHADAIAFLGHAGRYWPLARWRSLARIRGSIHRRARIAERVPQ
jgi:hypothetical protein